MFEALASGWAGMPLPLLVLLGMSACSDPPRAVTPDSSAADTAGGQAPSAAGESEPSPEPQRHLEGTRVCPYVAEDLAALCDHIADMVPEPDGPDDEGEEIPTCDWDEERRVASATRGTRWRGLVLGYREDYREVLYLVRERAGRLEAFLERDVGAWSITFDESSHEGYELRAQNDGSTALQLEVDRTYTSRTDLGWRCAMGELEPGDNCGQGEERGVDTSQRVRCEADGCCVFGEEVESNYSSRDEG